MGKAIERLYWDTRDERPKSTKYTKAAGQADEILRRLQKTLNEEQEQLMIKLMDIDSAMREEDMVDSFAHGFKLGIKLAGEIEE